MRSTNRVVVSAVVVLLALAILGAVAYGVSSGIADGQRKAATRNDAIVSGSVPGTASAQSGESTSAAAPALGAPAANLAIAQPAPGSFNPGGPPYGGAGGVAADGLSAWGVAYREVSDANAQADAALVKAAYQDAEKKATDLASATGNKLGKLLALADYSNNQPYFKPCVQTGIPPKGAPVPQDANPGGSAPASGAGAATGSTAIAPAPCQVSGNNHYLVVWVYVRHAL